MKIPMKEVYEMKLYNVYYLCSNLLEIFSQEKITSIDNNRAFYIEEWDKYTEALESLKQVPMFTEITTKLYESIPVFLRNSERPSVDTKTKDNFVKLNNLLVTQMSTIVTLCESMNLQNSENGIDVKIPQCTELKEYLEYLKDLDFIFTQCPYLLFEDEQIQFYNVDVGSNWLSFLVKLKDIKSIGSKILTNLASLIDKAMVLKSHYVSIKQQQEILKKMKQKNELMDTELEIFNILKREYMNQAMSELSNEIGQLNNGEEINKTEKSLVKLADLLDKGLEIYASIDTPKEVQTLFPEIGDTKKLPDDILKYIEEKTLQSSDEE